MIRMKLLPRAVVCNGRLGPLRQTRGFRWRETASPVSDAWSAFREVGYSSEYFELSRVRHSPSESSSTPYVSCSISQFRPGGLQKPGSGPGVVVCGEVALVRVSVERRSTWTLKLEYRTVNSRNMSEGHASTKHALDRTCFLFGLVKTLSEWKGPVVRVLLSTTTTLLHMASSVQVFVPMLPRNSTTASHISRCAGSWLQLLSITKHATWTSTISFSSLLLRRQGTPSAILYAVSSHSANW